MARDRLRDPIALADSDLLQFDAAAIASSRRLSIHARRPDEVALGPTTLFVPSRPPDDRAGNQTKYTSLILTI